MKTIIAGSRHFDHPFYLSHALDQSKLIADTTFIISGGASGIDSLAIQYAIDNLIPYQIFEADWKSLGAKAGPMRNSDMLEAAEALIVIWDGKSSGTFDMLSQWIRFGGDRDKCEVFLAITPNYIQKMPISLLISTFFVSSKK